MSYPQKWAEQVVLNVMEKFGMKQLTIELRYYDNDNPDIDEVIVPAAKMAAKHIFTTACLIAGKRKPQIALRTSDMFVAEEEISLAEDISEQTNDEAA